MKVFSMEVGRGRGTKGCRTGALPSCGRQGHRWKSFYLNPTLEKLSHLPRFHLSLFRSWFMPRRQHGEGLALQNRVLVVR